GPTSTTITAANISFNLVDGSRSIDGGVTGEQSLTLDAAGGSIGFGGAVGAATPLGALSLIDSSLYLSSGVTTSGGIISEAGSTLLSGATSLDTTAGGAVPGGANVTFTGAIEGPESLSINAGTASTITLGSDIGAHTTLAALTALSLFDAVLSVPANFSITTAGGAVTETGATITAGGAAPTSFSVDTTNAGAVPAGANILFGSIGGGAPGTLTLALDAGTGGTITLLGDLGATAALSALSVTDAALQIGANVSVTTAGTPFVETGKTVLLGNSAGATLTTIDTTDHGARAGADITFGGSIDGGTSGKQSLTLDAGSAAVALGGSVGAATALGSVTLDDATLRLAAGIAIDTVGGAVMQSGATILLDLPLEPAVTNVTIATGGGNISFVGPIDGTDEGGQALTLIAGSGGTISLDDNVGASVPLGGLSLSAGTITVGGSLYQTMDGPITMNGTVSFIAPLVTIASVIPPSDGLPATTGANISLASVSGVATTLTLDPGIDAASIAGGDLLRIAILEGNGSSLTDLDAGTTSLGGEGIGTNITVGGFSGVFASQHAFIRPGGHWTINAGNVLITDPALAGLTNSVLSNEGVGTAIALMNQIQQLIARGDTGETAAQQAFLQSPDRPDYALDPFRQRYNILGVDQGNAGGFEDLSYVTDGFWEGLLKK
ncbi:MAG TPA: hypothetical protein VL993_04720, partial [Stellaceae bacterium]|nr:hypothetical protein [Stellaceae bacterium]